MKHTPLSLFTSVCLVFSSSAATRYVNVNNPSPSPPYTNWATAAVAIQQAIDEAVAGDLILVTNGVYQTGVVRDAYGMSNRAAVTKPVTVQSVSGPAVTHIVGYQMPGTTNGPEAIRCVYLATGASLSGFTLRNGATQSYGAPATLLSGGGAWCESTNAMLTNCVLSGNSAHDRGGGASGGTLINCILISNVAHASGGGVCAGTLIDCTLTGNSALHYGGGADGGWFTNCTLSGNWTSGRGGGAYGATLNNCAVSRNSANSGGGTHGGSVRNCTLTSNTAWESGGGAYGGTLNNCSLTCNSARVRGGGAYGSTLRNCIIYFNVAESGAMNWGGGALSYCCTFPLPTSGASNITADPMLASASYLGAGSPCRGAGSAAFASGVDIDGEPWANPPSIGCDEYSGAS